MTDRPIINTADVRSRCEMSIKNTAAGGYLGDALTEVDKLRELVETIKQAIFDYGLDIDQCDICGKVMLTVPDGIICWCNACHKERADD